MLCKYCNTKLQDDDNFCYNCGKKVEKEKVEEAPIMPEIKIDSAKTPDEQGETVTIDSSETEKTEIKEEAEEKTEEVKEETPVKEAEAPLSNDSSNEESMVETPINATKEESEVIAPEKPIKEKKSLSQIINEKIPNKKTRIALILIIVGVILAFAIPMAINSGNYNKGLEAFRASNYKEAKAYFTDLKGYKDSEEYVEFIGAITDFEDNNYEACYDVFSKFNSKSDSKFKNDAHNYVAYMDALREYEAGEFYSAYTLFDSITSFKDSYEQSLNCIQERPSSKVVFRNSDYAGSSMSIRIVSPSSGEDVYAKIYTSDDVLVGSVYIRDGESAKISLSAGTYKIKCAYGNGDRWFGDKGAYGEDGYYKNLLLDGNNELYAFANQYDYTLTLSVTSGGNVGSENTTYGDF